MVVVKGPTKIKTQSNLKRAVRYILNEAKTLSQETKVESPIDFPFVSQNGEVNRQLVSGHLIEDVSIADEEMLLTKLSAALHKGDQDLKELNDDNQVLAYHIIQSFSPEDNLTPEQVHEIGRQTMLEFTGGDYEFVIATHMDKGHLHNHIILSSTNASTLKKSRWKKKDFHNLRAISDKVAAKYHARIIEPSMKNSYTKYSAWRRQNNFSYEIKQRLNFLLKHSTSLEDFTHKAKALDLHIDLSGKFVKYRLLIPLNGKRQERNIRDRSLSSKRAYSLEAIKERLAQNEVGYDLSEIKERYQEIKAQTDNDYELKLAVESWQVEQESKDGIYLQMDYGALNSGTIKIPAHKVDKMLDGNYTIYIKENDYFYFLNPDNAKRNRYMMGKTVARQLAKQNGELLITKNPYISSLNELVKEYNFLVQHQVTTGNQFKQLEKDLNAKLQAVHKELKHLDERLSFYHKVEGALLALKQTPENSLPARTLLNELGIPKDMTIDDVNQTIQTYTIEKGALQEHFDNILSQYTNYQKIKDNVRYREADKPYHHEKEKTR